MWEMTTNWQKFGLKRKTVREAHFVRLLHPPQTTDRNIALTDCWYGNK